MCAPSQPLLDCSQPLLGANCMALITTKSRCPMARAFSTVVTMAQAAPGALQYKWSDPWEVCFHGLDGEPVALSTRNTESRVSALAFEGKFYALWSDITHRDPNLAPGTFAILVTVDGTTYSAADAITAGVLEAGFLRAFDGTDGYDAAGTFAPWTGYFVNNADPGENNDLAPSGHDALMRLEAELDAAMTAAARHHAEGGEVLLDPATQERLRALGYIQ